VPTKHEVWATVQASGKAVEITENLGRIDYDNLAKEVGDVNAEGNWWSILTARARKRAKNAAQDVDVLQAQLRKAARIAALSRGEKFTVDVINDEVTMDPRMIAAKRAVADAEEEAEILDSAKWALSGKGRMLQEIAGLVREEISARRAGVPFAPSTPDPAPSARPPARRQPMR